MFMFLKYAYKLLSRGPVQLLEKSGICKLLHISKDSVTNTICNVKKCNYSNTRKNILIYSCLSVYSTRICNGEGVWLIQDQQHQRPLRPVSYIPPALMEQHRPAISLNAIAALQSCGFTEIRQAPADLRD